MDIEGIMDYSPETGEFRWKINAGGTARIGSRAGTKHNKGYISLHLSGKVWLAHRLAWTIVHGEIPIGMQIDHINGVKTDNRIVNLRCVNGSYNQQNRKKAARHNKSGILGARFDGRKYSSTITVNGESKYLGYFNTAEDAHLAYLKAKREMHPGNML